MQRACPLGRRYCKEKNQFLVKKRYFSKEALPRRRRRKGDKRSNKEQQVCVLVLLIGFQCMMKCHVKCVLLKRNHHQEALQYKFYSKTSDTGGDIPEQVTALWL